VAAIDALGRRGEPGSVARLLRLLPGDGDVVTLRVVVALGHIGDRRALPVLRKLRDDPDVHFPGKINVSLERAVQALQRR
jgi:HEAT repeat protein